MSAAQQPSGAKGQWVGKTLLQHYRLTDLLGHGAAGEVYRGVDSRDQGLVAVKTMAPAIADHVEWVKRFRREAKVLAKLDHPHSVRFVDHGHTADGVAVLVMEFLDGEDLFRYLRRRGRLPLQTSLELTVQMLGALADAHGKGILHRDLKPSNVYLVDLRAATPTAKLIDFGLAKADATDEVERLTREGAIVGTPAYMSPEQCMGQPLGPASDLYAVGALLFEMLTGRPPFEASTPMGLLTKHLSAPIPEIAALRPDLPHPEPLQALFDSWLAKRPAARPASAMAAIAQADGLLRQVQARTQEHESTAVEMMAISEDDEGPAPSALDSLVEAGARAAMAHVAVRAPAPPDEQTTSATIPLPKKPAAIAPTPGEAPALPPRPRPASSMNALRRPPRGVVQIAATTMKLRVEAVLMAPAGAPAPTGVRAAIWLDGPRPPISVPLQAAGASYRGDATMARASTAGLLLAFEAEAPAGTRWSLRVLAVDEAPRVLVQREGMLSAPGLQLQLPIGG